MPTKQLHSQLEKSLGVDWRSKVASFDETPIAAASIGQVKHSCAESNYRVVKLLKRDLKSRVWLLDPTANGIGAMRRTCSRLGLRKVFPEGRTL